MIRIILFVSILFFIIVSCSDYTPRPVGYNRIERTDFLYKEFSGSNFSFEYPEKAFIDSIFTGEDARQWFNIVYPDYHARIYCSYLPITRSQLKEVLDDNHRLVYSHTIKANDIDQMLYSYPERDISGILYEIGGQVATPIQFFLTDSTTNFFRGSLYYDLQVNNDSVFPVTEIIKEDIIRLMETFKWG